MDLSASITLSADAVLAAALCAVDPAGLGGVALRAPSGPLRDTWLGLLKQSLPTDTPLLRVPHHASDAALLGGLDLAATLQAGRPVAQRGLLARADGGLLLLAMAERCSANVAAHLSAALDTQQVQLQRDGLSTCEPARFGLVALDEGNEDNESERLPATLLDRLAFQLSLAISTDPDGVPNWTADDIEEARKLLPQVQVPDAIVQRLNFALNDALKDPEIAGKFKAMGFDLVGGPPSTLGNLMRSETTKWKQVIDAANIKAQ